MAGAPRRKDTWRNVGIELPDVSKEHLRADFDDAPEVIHSSLYRHTYNQEYHTPGSELFPELVWIIALIIPAESSEGIHDAAMFKYLILA